MIDAGSFLNRFFLDKLQPDVLAHSSSFACMIAHDVLQCQKGLRLTAITHKLCMAIGIIDRPHLLIHFFILKHYSLEVLLLVSVENISMVFSLKHSNVSLWVVKR